MTHHVPAVHGQLGRRRWRLVASLLGPFAAFGLVSVGLWAYFRVREARRSGGA